MYNDLSLGYPVDCSSNRYVEGDDEEEESQVDSQPEEKTPKTKAKSDNSKAPKSPSITQCGQPTSASSTGTMAPTGKGLNTAVNHFSPSQGGNTQSQAVATATGTAILGTKPAPNPGPKKPCASG